MRFGIAVLANLAHVIIHAARRWGEALMGCANFTGQAADFCAVIQYAAFSVLVTCNMADFVDTGFVGLTAVGTAGIFLRAAVIA